MEKDSVATTLDMPKILELWCWKDLRKTRRIDFQIKSKSVILTDVLERTMHVHRACVSITL